MRLARRLSVLALTGISFTPLAVHAADEERAAEPAVASALEVELDVARAGLDLEVVRQAIESELGVPVKLVSGPSAAPTLVVRADGRRRATAIAKSASGARVERVIELPRDQGQATESLAWLAGNLARDEAAELIAALRVEPEPSEPPPPEPEEPAQPPPPPAPPAPPPKPASSPPKPAAASSGKDARPEVDRRAAFDWRRSVNLSLAHPIALLPDANERTLALELGLVYSELGGLRGAGFDLAVLRVRGPVEGAALSMVFTQTGPVDGVAMSVGATSSERVRGAQVAVGAVVTKDAVEGAQASVGASIAGGHVSGAQLSVGANVANGDVAGAQVTVGGNLARGTVRGAQLAVGLNLAGDVPGLQLGLVNIGKNVDGLQLGLINVADEVDGLSLGLVNVARGMRVQAVGFASNAEPVNAGLKLVTGYVYTQYSAAYRWDSDEAGFELGIGPHFELGPTYLELGVHWARGFGDNGGTLDAARWNALIERLAVGLELGPGIEPFAGLGVRHGIESTGDDPYLLYFAGISLFGARSSQGVAKNPPAR